MSYSINSKWPLFIFIVCVIFMCISFRGPQKGIQDKRLVTGQPGMNVYPDKLPGETALLKRPYDSAPPLVPHTVADFSINRAENECFDCHFEGLEVDEGHTATKIPPSHFTNEHTGQKREEQVIGIQYNCLQCHVPQATAEPPYAEKIK